MESKLDYYTMAELDRPYLEDALNRDWVVNALCVSIQTCVERYLKHVVDKLYSPKVESESRDKAELLHTHNIKKLINFITGTMGIEISDVDYRDIIGADGYYFTARYPGDDAVVVTKRDMINCRAALETAYRVVTEIMEESETPEMKHATPQEVRQLLQDSFE